MVFCVVVYCWHEYFFGKKIVFFNMKKSVILYAIMESVFNSTFHSMLSQRSGRQTAESASSAIAPGRVTDKTIGPSIFDLPVENLRKLQERESDKSDSDKKYV